MKILQPFLKLLNRLRYPASTPEEVSEALGIEFSNDLYFKEFLNKLLSSNNQPTRLFKFMPRIEAEKAFQGAIKKEFFLQSSLFSYSFNEGWMEFELYFDAEERLRRIWLHHQMIPDSEGFEIRLKSIWDHPQEIEEREANMQDQTEEELIVDNPTLPLLFLTFSILTFCNPI